MKAFSLIICIVLSICLIGSSFGAVVPYYEDFNYSADTNPADVLPWDVTGGSPYFNGQGQLVMSRQSGSNDDLDHYYIGSGDFAATVSLVDIDMAPVDGWSVWNYKIYHHGGHSIAMNLDSSGSGENENVSIWIDAWSETISGNQYGEFIGGIDSLVLHVAYDSAAGTYTWSRAVDGGPMEQMLVLEGYTSPDDSRRIRWHSDHMTTHPSVAIDSFSVVPEPATIALLTLGAAVALRRRRS